MADRGEGDETTEEGLAAVAAAGRDAAVHATYYLTLLASDVPAPVAQAMTVAYISATKMNARIELPPDPDSREHW